MQPLTEDLGKSRLYPELIPEQREATGSVCVGGGPPLVCLAPAHPTASCS